MCLYNYLKIYMNAIDFFYNSHLPPITALYVQVLNICLNELIECGNQWWKIKLVEHTIKLITLNIKQEVWL